MLEFPVLFLKLLDSLEFIELHATILGLPIVDRRFGDAVFAGNIQDVLASIIFLKNANNLGFSESGFFHS